jgi:hypothetical protein
LLLLLCKKTISAESESKEELVQSESKDGKLEIIKQIKKVNDDGSYTIGYEADDGSFKIESRDVLGNIKGTYGYIDDSGQIKRVSYSTSNSSEVLTKSEPAASVVQRIPKTNRTHTTKRPSSIYSTTLSTPTSTTALQRIAKLRSSTTTTDRPNYSEVVNVESELSKTTPKPPHIVYPTSTPRILLQGRPIIRSTPPTHTQTQKSEGQLIRPEVVTARPTELPLFRRLALKHQILNEGKPIAEEPEVRSNILRRQLSQEKTSNFDPQQHVFTLQQSLGNDATDVYSASVTTGTPRPLFTTTNRPRALLSTTTSPTVVSRPTIRYPLNYQRNVLQDLESNTPEYAQETTTTQTTANEATPTPVPIVQIPANRAPQEPLVAIRHPFQRGTILVPLSQLQGRVLPVDLNEHQPQYVGPNEQYIKETTPKPTPETEPRPIYVRRLPPPQFRPIPVQVDENGFIREVQRPSNGPVPSYPLPIPVTPAPKYIDNVGDNDIEDISPPVSTRDFQKLLQQLILRQSRLERISALTDPRRNPEFYHSRYRPMYRPTSIPYYFQREAEAQQTGPVQFLPENNLQPRQRQYVHLSPQHQAAIRQQQRQEQEIYNQNSQSFVPTRRVARLLQPSQDQQQETKEEYLPPDVREMLLLRMLQLAINPALPVAEDEMVQDTTPVPQYKKVPVRNVEILGEEAEEEKRPVRNKRYREPHMDYYE